MKIKCSPTLSLLLQPLLQPLLLPLLLPLILILLLGISNGEHPRNRACGNFNYASANAALAGQNGAYVCPADGIAGVACTETFPLKPISNITKVHITGADYVIYLLIGPNSPLDVLQWWLPFVAHDSPESHMDFVIVGDACAGGTETCDDRAVQFQRELVDKGIKGVNTHVVRCDETDNGYNLLSCKLRTGLKRIYELFPHKKYYFKVDTDTILLPRRFHNFLSTMEATMETEALPIYFGTVVESGMDMLLCGRQWETEGNAPKGGLCYGQGGAGYGFNNVAMKAMATQVPNCTSETPFAKSFDGQSPEDVFAALSMHRLFNISVIHCGGFRSSELVSPELFKQSITFHYIDWKWLQQHGETVAHHYKSKTHG